MKITTLIPSQATRKGRLTLVLGVIFCLVLGWLLARLTINLAELLAAQAQFPISALVLGTLLAMGFLMLLAIYVMAGPSIFVRAYHPHFGSESVSSLSLESDESRDS